MPCLQLSYYSQTTRLAQIALVRHYHGS
jgi:hypothetical protein